MRVLAVAFLLLFVLTACDNKEEVRMQAIYHTLSNNTKNFDSLNNTILTGLRQDLNDPQTFQKASVWQPMAQSIDSAASVVSRLIDGMQRTDTHVKTLDIRQLSERMVAFKQTMKDILNPAPFAENPMLARDVAAFRERAMATLLPDITFDSTVNKFIDEHTSSLLHGGQNPEKKIMLERIKNELLYAEYKVVTYLNQNVPGNIDIHNPFSCILSQSSNNLTTGEEMTITVGVGEFKTFMQPKFLIDGKKIESERNGVARYRFEVNQPPGEYNIPVSVSFIRPDGLKAKIDNNVRYRVVKTIK